MIQLSRSTQCERPFTSDIKSQAARRRRRGSTFSGGTAGGNWGRYDLWVHRLRVLEPAVRGMLPAPVWAVRSLSARASTEKVQTALTVRRAKLRKRISRIYRAARAALRLLVGRAARAAIPQQRDQAQKQIQVRAAVAAVSSVPALKFIQVKAAARAQQLTAKSITHRLHGLSRSQVRSVQKARAVRVQRSAATAAKVQRKCGSIFNDPRSRH